MSQDNQTWIAMFRRIPDDLHDTLVLGLNTGAEIVLQKFVKLEPDFMILRGRVSGTQDAGRVIMIPYGQLSFVALTKLLKDPEVEAIFGKGAPPARADTPESPPAGKSLPEAAPAAAETTPASGAAEESNAPKKPDQSSKSVLLAKLRDRLKDSR